MSGPENKSYPKGKLIQCQKCNEVQKLPMEVTEGMLPVKLRCGNCKAVTMELLSIKILPKWAPTGEEGDWGVIGSELVELEEDEQRDKRKTKNTPAPDANFQNHADKIEGIMLQGMEAMVDLNLDLEKFQNSFLEHFQSQHQLLDLYSVKFDEYYLEEFVKNPFFSLRIKCEDELLSEYARLLVYPRFFLGELGFKLDAIGTFNIEVCNSFTLLYRPFTAALCRFLEMPLPLDLTVYGNKIIGSSLPHCFRDIPGTLEDYDHRLDSPSIRIASNGNCVARLWLARHAVKCWQPRAVTIDHIRKDSEQEVELLADKQTANCYQKFLAAGRLGIFSADVMQMRKAAASIGRCLNGTKLVLLANREQKVAYEAVLGSFDVSVRVLANEWLFMDMSVIDVNSGGFKASLESVRTIIVDGLYSVKPAFLKSLFDFDGNLILLSNNPIKDFNSSAEEDTLTHALTADKVYLYEKMQKHPFGTRLDSPILDALRGLNERKLK